MEEINKPRPTQLMSQEEYGENHVERIRALLQMVEAKEAYTKKEVDEKGELKSFKIFRNNGELLCFVDKAGIDEWVRNNFKL